MLLGNDRFKLDRVKLDVSYELVEYQALEHFGQSWQNRNGTVVRIRLRLINLGDRRDSPHLPEFRKAGCSYASIYDISQKIR